MEKMNKGTLTLTAVFLLACLSASVNFSVCLPFWTRQNQEAASYGMRIESSKELLSRKQILETQWDAKKSLLREGASEEMLNGWMKEIFAYAQAHSLKIDKMEPAGTKQTDGKKEPLLFLTFQADIKQWTAFLYYLLESDPMAKIESFSLKQNEDSKHLSIELVLGKVVL